jgi:hypothetical protein
MGVGKRRAEDGVLNSECGMRNEINRSWEAGRLRSWEAEKLGSWEAEKLKS